MQKILAVCLLVSLLGAPAVFGAIAPVLVNVLLDIDGDGRGDSVTVSKDGRLAVRRADGMIEALSFSALPELAGAFLETWISATNVRYLRVEGRLVRGGRLLLLAVLRQGRLVEIYNGPLGPVGRDAEYSVEVKFAEGEIWRYQSTAAVRRCDGESRLFFEHYVEPAGWQPVSTLEPPPLPASAPLRTTSSLPGDFASPPLGVYRYVAASAQLGIERADLLTPPRELEDGNRSTAWRLRKAARGAFVTAQADGPGHSVTALRFEPAATGLGRLPRQLLLMFDGQNILNVELLPTTATQWLRLPQPVSGGCLSVVIAQGADGDMTALGEIAIYSELDGPGGAQQLVAQIAGGDSASFEGAQRTLLLLLRRQPALSSAILEAALAQLAAPELSAHLKRRLEDLLLRLAQTPALANLVAERVAAFLRKQLAQASLSERLERLSTLEHAEAFGQLVLGQVLLDDTLPSALRTEALARLRCLPPNHPSLQAAQELFTLRLRRAAELPWSDERAVAEHSFVAELAQALSRSLSRCSDGAARLQVVDLLTSAWPPSPPASEKRSDAAEKSLFVLRYRLLQALERLATATAQSQALLVQLLEHEEEPVLRQAASRALLTMMPADAARGLRDRDAGVRLATLASLGARDARKPGELDAPLLATLEELLQKDAWPQVRRSAVEVRAAACSSHQHSSVPALRSAVTDKDEQVQKQALVSTARCEGAGAIDLLVQTAEAVPADERQGPGLRGVSCALLSRYGFGAKNSDAAAQARAHKAAATALLNLLTEPAADERHAAAIAQCVHGLGEAGDERDLPALLEVAGSEVPAALRQGALKSLGAICQRGPKWTASLQKNVMALLKTAAADADAKVSATAQKAQTLCK